MDTLRRPIALSVFIACMSGMFLPRLAVAEVIRVLVLADTPPFAYTQDNELRGFNVDIAKDVCRRLEVSCEIHVATLGAILATIAAGHAEIGMGNMLKTEERAKQVLFSIPLWRSTSSFVGRRGLHLAKQKARMAVVSGSVQAEYLYRTFPDATIIEAPSTAASLQLVEEGSADYTLLPVAVASEIVRRSSRLMFTGEKVQDPKLGGTVHVIFPQDRDDLRRKVDGAIEDIIADGTYFRISRRYFPFDLH